MRSSSHKGATQGGTFPHSMPVSDVGMGSREVHGYPGCVCKGKARVYVSIAWCLLNPPHKPVLSVMRGSPSGPFIADVHLRKGAGPVNLGIYPYKLPPNKILLPL